VAVLLHGWPYDIHSYVEVAPLLAAEGYRVVVPYLRGFGTTRFRSDATFRNGEQAALALDVIALLDALEIERAILAGFDWGARTAGIVAALWPERCTALVSVSGYLIGSQKAGKVPLPPAAELQWWYQYYFATERGRLGYGEHRREFNRLIWRTASPKWNFDDATFDRTAQSFDNPDFVEVVIHSYRHRHRNAPGEPRFDRVERDLAARPPITVPTIVLHGAEDTVDPPARSEGHLSLFPGGTERRVVAGGGHLLSREQPVAIAEAMLRLLAGTT
jgi:pimeloyl-ACP methyl ester carboxylesterase